MYSVVRNLRQFFFPTLYAICGTIPLFGNGTEALAQPFPTAQITNFTNGTVYSPWPIYINNQLNLFFGGEDQVDNSYPKTQRFQYGNPPQFADQIYRASCQTVTSCQSYTTVIPASYFSNVSNFAAVNDPHVVFSPYTGGYVMFMTVGLYDSQNVIQNNIYVATSTDGLSNWSIPQAYLSGWAYPSTLQDSVGDFWLYATWVSTGAVWRFTLGGPSGSLPLSISNGQQVSFVFNINGGHYPTTYPYFSVVYTPPGPNNSTALYNAFGQGEPSSGSPQNYLQTDYLASTDGVNFSFQFENNMTPITQSNTGIYSPTPLQFYPCYLYYGQQNDNNRVQYNGTPVGTPVGNIFVSNWCNQALPASGSPLTVSNKY